ncbi:hypothetical protein [Nocardioides kribbensis]|uniref:XRE family transcriptional regulator n=1 Tax=Nocardioides kribbensis TaxID=305517 RepID=A0ABV1NZ28_9ACTN
MTQTLADLLRQAMDKRGVRSGRALADLTSGREHTIDRTQVNNILRGTYKHRPGDSLIKAVAWLAAVDDEVAFKAAGIPMPGPPFAAELPPGVDNLGPQERRAIITVIRAFLGVAEEGEVRNDAGSAANTEDDQESGALVVELNPKTPKVPASGTRAARKSTQPPLAKDPDATED